MAVEPSATFAQLRATLAADATASCRYQRALFGYRPVTWWLDPGFVAVAMYRVSHFAAERQHIFIARVLAQANTLLTGAEIPPESRIGPGLLVPSPLAICLYGRAGAGLTLQALSGVGSRMRHDDAAAGGALPILGDGVSIGLFSGILKPVQIGNGAVIGAGAGALRDIPAGGRTINAVAPQRGPPPPRPSARAVPRCSHDRWVTSWQDYRADLERTIAELARFGAGPANAGPASARRRLRVALFSPLIALLTYRIAHWLHCNGHRRSARGCAALNRLFHKITIVPQACLGGGAFIPHLAGTVINATIGRNLTVYSNTLCAPWRGAHAPVADGPVLGDNVRIGAHSAILGPVDIGSRVFLAMKVNLFNTIGDGHGVFSPMARLALGDPTGNRPNHPQPVAMPIWSREALRRGDARRRATQAAQGVRTSIGARLAVALYRRTHAHHSAGRLRRARWTWLANVYATGIDISPMSQIGPGLWIDSPAGVAFHGRAGSDLSLMAQSVVGAELSAERCVAPLAAAPVLGDGVTLHPHAVVAGAVTIGDRSVIYPGCTVLTDIADDSSIVPRPVRLRPFAAVDA